MVHYIYQTTSDRLTIDRLTKTLVWGRCKDLEIDPLLKVFYDDFFKGDPMQTRRGSCHCGKVKFDATGAFNEAMSCNCSMCQRKGTLLAFIPETQFTLISGADSLTDYQFGEKKIHHTFCSTCGVTSFASGETPDGAKIKAINVRCLEDIDLKTLTVQECDGRSF